MLGLSLPGPGGPVLLAAVSGAVKGGTIGFATAFRAPLSATANASLKVHPTAVSCKCLSAVLHLGVWLVVSAYVCHQVALAKDGSGSMQRHHMALSCHAHCEPAGTELRLQLHLGALGLLSAACMHLLCYPPLVTACTSTHLSTITGCHCRWSHGERGGGALRDWTGC